MLVPSDLVDMLSYHMYVHTIPMYGYMDRCFRYRPTKSLQLAALTGKYTDTGESPIAFSQSLVIWSPSDPLDYKKPALYLVAVTDQTGTLASAGYPTSLI